MKHGNSKIGLTTATAIVVANMVGTGIFGSLGYQVAAIPSGFPILLLWLSGGLMSLCGALCYSEMAAMSPKSGGEYRLLKTAWPDWVGFLSGWISVTAGFTAPIALTASLLGNYMKGVFGLHPNLFSIPVVVIVTLIHLGKIQSIAHFQTLFTTVKIGLIFTLGLLGFILGSGQEGLSFLPQAGDGQLIFSPDFGTSLVFVLYAYAGWNAATYMIDEIDDPKRTVPWAILIGTSIVTLLYVFLNAAFLYSTPMDSLAGNAEAGLIASRSILGETGGSIMGIMIAFGLISTISSMTWAGPRVTSEIGKDYTAFRWLAKSNQHGIPALAIVLQTTVVIVLILTSTFEQLLHYIQALLTLSSIGVVLGMFWLRLRQPNLKRPFRTPCFPLVPLVFLISSAGVLFFQIGEKPLQCAWGFLTLLLGFLVYRFFARNPTRDSSKY